MTKNTFQLAPDEAGRLEQLKAFIREHAGMFDMAPWIEMNDQSTAAQYGGWRRKMSAMPPEERIRYFESCGTACCIGGACEVLSGISGSGAAAANAMGVRGPSENFSGGDLEVFFKYNWPEDIKTEYEEAYQRRDVIAMAEAGIKAIDHFNSLPETKSPSKEEFLR